MIASVQIRHLSQKIQKWGFGLNPYIGGIERLWSPRSRSGISLKRYKCEVLD